MRDRHPSYRFPLLCLLGLTLAGVLASAAPLGALERLSVTTTEDEALVASGAPSTNDDGRYVAFASSDSLADVDDNGVADIYVRDRVAGVTVLASLANAAILGLGREVANGPSHSPSMNAGGRFVAFTSGASNLIGSDGNGVDDVFVRDLLGDVVRASATLGGGDANGPSGRPSLSANGRLVAFESTASNLVADGNNASDIFVRNLVTGAIRRVSTAANGAEADGGSFNPMISGDGRFVIFESDATNLVTPDANMKRDVFVKNLLTGAIERVSVGDNGLEADEDSFNGAINGTGRFVVFSSNTTNFSGPVGQTSVYMRDRVDDSITLISVNDDGDPADADSGQFVATVPGAGAVESGRSSISDDGRFVAFVSAATNLDPLDNNSFVDVFVRDIVDETTGRCSVGVNEGDQDSSHPALSRNGNFLAFQSPAGTLVQDDTNNVLDVFGATIRTAGDPNDPPDADAGPDQFVAELDAVMLDASGSSSPAGLALNFRWRQLNPTPATRVQLTPDAIDPAVVHFTAPLVVDFATLEFEVEVRDGVNPPVTDEVEVQVTPATAGMIVGNVSGVGGGPLVGALVRVVRVDGVVSDTAIADGNGDYVLNAVRIGSSIITCEAVGLDSVSRAIDVTSAPPVMLEDFVLDRPSATLEGSVQLPDGSPVVGATVALLDPAGNVFENLSGHKLLAQTDAAGNYRIQNIPTSAIQGAGSVRATHDAIGLIPWAIANPQLSARALNRIDFRYGILKVRVTGRSRAVQRMLGGTVVQVVIGGEVVEENVVRQGHTNFTFNALPAVFVRVNAFNRQKQLTGATASVTVPPGPRPRKVTLTMRRYGVF